MYSVSYLSKRARIKGHVMPFSIVLGESSVGGDSFIDNFVILGYPTRSKLKGLKRPLTLESIDEVSDGSMIGDSCIIRSNCVIYEGVQIGDGVEFGHDVLVRSGSKIGRESRIGSGAQLDGSVKIGEGCSIQSLAYLPHLTEVADNVFIGPGVTVTNDRYPPSENLAGVSIGEGAVIGARSVLLPGIRIGRGAVVAAGSVVTENVNEWKVVMGVPAREVYDRREYELRRGSRK
ncbi:MAG: acetyltransferase [Aigarchaeota archaeon]|nr:acetyltransferase [Aigarchaeota archaeon]MDW8092756.1 acyltransferase [Nitrososphaerota archaeon]